MKRRLAAILTFVLLVFSFAYAAEGTTKTNGQQIPFQYYFRGFVPLDSSNATEFPEGMFLIDSSKCYENFMQVTQLGSIFPEVSVDFAKESLIFLSSMSAKPTFSTSTRIASIHVVNGNLNFTWDDSQRITALNTEKTYHVFVQLIKVQKSDLPKGWMRSGTVGKAMAQSLYPILTDTYLDTISETNHAEVFDADKVVKAFLATQTNEPMTGQIRLTSIAPEERRYRYTPASSDDSTIDLHLRRMLLPSNGQTLAIWIVDAYDFPDIKK